MTNNINIYNPYATLKAKAKNEYRQRDIANMLTNSLVSMFTYKKSDEYVHIDDSTIELSLILNGLCAWAYDDSKKIICGIAYDGGILDINGIGNIINIALLNGKSFTRSNNIDCVIGKNNPIKAPDTDIFITANWLTESTLSEENNVKFTRLSPLYIAKNRKIFSMIKEALGNLKKGEPMIISDETISLSDSKSIEVTGVTDITAIDKLQYLTTYYNAIMRRWYNRYGHNISDGMKQAQQSVAEVSSSDTASMIEPLARLKERKIMCEKVSKMFGGVISVDFSEAWKAQNNNIIEDIKGDNKNESN